MDIASILVDRYPEQQWNLTNNDYDTLVWETVNSVPKPTLEELENAWPTVLDTKKLNELRTERNTLLDQSDKYMTVDYPHPTPEKKQEWLDYRQTLRDLPTATEDPTNPVWPVAPQ
uniref:Phage tail assembly chaperone-like domain-containing protein n=1 Tax=viral metagenome TaxID=1070528 RepID=A0A6C0CNS0_9ZZZZ